MWAVRQKRYKNIAVADGLLAIVMVAVQLGAGFIGIGAEGLLGGLLAGTALAVVLLGVFAHRSGAFATLRKFDPKAKWALARKHYRFPLYAMPTSLLERSSKRLPVFLMALFFSPIEAGYYWLCFRFVVAPVRLIVQNSRKPYYKQALDLRAKGESLAPLFWNSTGALAAFAVPMVVAMILLAPSLFEILFGQEWQRAGQYAQWLTVATAASVLSMPCIDLAPIFQRQGHVLAFQTAQAIMRALAIVAGGLMGDDLLTIALFAISSCVMTVVMIGYFWRLIGTGSDLMAIPASEGVGRE
jgi:O-antigen/teichoic acid export membrane protein